VCRSFSLRMDYTQAYVRLGLESLAGEEKERTDTRRTALLSASRSAARRATKLGSQRSPSHPKNVHAIYGIHIWIPDFFRTSCCSLKENFSGKSVYVSTVRHCEMVSFYLLFSFCLINRPPKIYSYRK